MLIVVLATTMTVATLMVTGFGLYKETERNRFHVEANKARFRPLRRPSVDLRRL